jgi:hypothetical protein
LQQGAQPLQVDAATFEPSKADVVVRRPRSIELRFSKPPLPLRRSRGSVEYERNASALSTMMFWLIAIVRCAGASGRKKTVGGRGCLRRRHMMR